MDLQIAALLAQDGITSGAIYALLGVALVLVFAVTRIIFIPQGEFVAFGALTLVTLQAGQIPGTVGLLCALALLVFLLDLPAALRGGSAVSLRSSLLSNLAYPLLLLIACYLLPLAQMPLLLQILLTLAILVPMGPQLYRIVYQPLADTSVLVLLIASIALH
ncbi:MAG: branched-chain amino acid ABC transporter permease, partial [Gammaproteobacteria bacterium]|nr:branched-chain amino acid ABC transporter permease [Gammaproteobacteria bacterium]